MKIGTGWLTRTRTAHGTLLSEGGQSVAKSVGHSATGMSEGLAGKGHSAATPSNPSEFIVTAEDQVPAV